MFVVTIHLWKKVVLSAESVTVTSMHNNKRQVFVRWGWEAKPTEHTSYLPSFVCFAWIERFNEAIDHKRKTTTTKAIDATASKLQTDPARVPPLYVFNYSSQRGVRRPDELLGSTPVRVPRKSKSVTILIARKKAAVSTLSTVRWGYFWSVFPGQNARKGVLCLLGLF